MPRYYYEDYIEGSVETFGPRTMTREEIIAFATEFDPQPMHLDEEAARHSMLKGLAASGWHTCSFMMRMMYDYCIRDSASLGSPGVEEVKWLKPVRPDVPLMLRRTVLDKRVSRSRPEMGLARIQWELLDETGTTLAVQTSFLLLARRLAEAAQ